MVSLDLLAVEFRMAYQRISIVHEIMGGVPCIAGTRIPVATIVGMIGDGATVEQLVDDYPQLSVDEVYEALHFAADAVRERELPLRTPA
jgi:uncharacterized protein (DUF433 family)